ncbi:MAG: hypothetical protein GQ574_00940 [Crocinitomix sp.]|nr:hypothetical protein [Crocinitomix sp.]
MIAQIHVNRLIAVVCFLLLSSCLKDKTIETVEYAFTCDDSISYSSEIVPMIIDQSCNVSGCHNSDTNAGGYSFSNHADVSSVSDIIFKTLTHQDEFVPMPLGGTIIHDSLIKKMYCWIEQGQLDN